MAKSSYRWNHDFPKLARDTGFVFNIRKPNVVINWNDINRNTQIVKSRLPSLASIVTDDVSSTGIPGKLPMNRKIFHLSKKTVFNIIQSPGSQLGSMKSREERKGQAIDIDRVIQERNFATVDEHLYQVLDCQLEKEFDVRILDAGFVKLFRLAQLSVEYLLHCRSHMDTVIPQLKNHLQDMEEEIDQLKKQLHSKEEEIRRLRNKTRKQQKTMDYVKNSDIANLLRRMAMNDGQVGVSSMGDQASKSFHKCIQCDKVFLNQFYLHSHIVRRHPNLPSFGGDNLSKNIEDNTFNNSPLHEAKYKAQNEKLILEIKELRDRVNATEKQLHLKEFNNDLAKITDFKDTNDINNMNAEKNKENNNEIIEKSKDKVEMDAMEKETVTLATFEEWKKTEQRNFMEQLEILKKQLADRGTLLNDVNKEKDNARNNEEMLTMRNILKQHEAEVNVLKKQLQEKMSSDFTELKNNLELQEKLWQQKMKNSEEEHSHTVEELKSTMLARLKESQTIQEQYRNRIDTLETSAKEQKIILEDQSRKLSVVGEMKNFSPPSIVNPIRKTTSLDVQKRLREGESHETLPPYDEGSSDESIIKPRAFVSDSPKSVKNNRRWKKIRTPTESESDDTSKIENITNLRDSVARSRKVTGKTGTVSSDSSLGNKQKRTNSKQNKPKNIISEISPIKNMRIQKDDGKKDATKSENHIKQNAVHLRKNKSLTKPHDLEESDSETSEYSDTSRSGSIIRPTKGGNVMKAVKNDLVLIVNKRLEQLGVLSDKKGLSGEAFEKSMAVVEHRRQLLSKKHDNFNRLRKGLYSALEQKLKEVKYNKSPSTAVHVHKSNVSLNKMGSLFSSVKNKAISIMKPRENVENIGKEMSRRPRGSSQIVQASYKRSPEKKNVSPIKNTSKQSVLSVLSYMKAASNIEENEIDKSSNDLRLSLSEPSSDSESLEDAESDYNNAKQIVTTVVSHASSKSVEKLLISPIRRLDKLTNDEDTSITSSTPTKKIANSTNRFGNASNIENDKKQSHKMEPKESIEKITKSEDNIPSMYAGATSSSDESDFDERQTELRKSVSEDNVNKVTTQKSVLKSVLSSGSLSKKKVLFDLDANEMKSLSTSPTVSGAVEVKAKENWELRASANTDSDSEWEISNVESDLIDHNATVHYNPPEEIKLSTKQSPKIAEISKTIGLQLGARTVKPPAGGIETMFQNKLDQNSPKNPDNNVTGNATVLNTASTSGRINIIQPIPKPRTVTQIKKSTLDSDLELSDWSLDDLLNAK